MMKWDSSNESGNALWVILLTVALLAALTATISRSTDTAEQSGNIELYRIHASDIMRHASSVRETVNGIRLKGIGENQISFENSFTSADYTNANAAGCLECLVYGSAGGGLSYRAPNPEWLDSGQSSQTHYGEWYIPRAVCVADVGRGSANCYNDASSNEELVLVLPWIKQGLCRQINAMLKVTPSGDPAPKNDDHAFSAGYPVYTGDLLAEGNVIIDSANVLSGVEAGCFEGSASNTRPPEKTYHFYQVLIRR